EIGRGHRFAVAGRRHRDDPLVGRLGGCRRPLDGGGRLADGRARFRRLGLGSLPGRRLASRRRRADLVAGRRRRFAQRKLLHRVCAGGAGRVGPLGRRRHRRLGRRRSGVRLGRRRGGGGRFLDGGGGGGCPLGGG